MEIFRILKEDFKTIFEKKKIDKTLDEKIHDLLIRVWIIGIVNLIIGIVLFCHVFNISL
jgi:hypothetical protein